jgi:hypothetical protein
MTYVSLVLDVSKMIAKCTRSPLMIVFLALFFVSTVHAAHREGIRGARYCEVILAQTRLNFSVFTTFGLNDCPDAAWKTITESSIKQETGSFFAHLNGPRYWVIDGFQQTLLQNDRVQTLGGLEMREAAILHLTLSDVFTGASPYRPHRVDRQTTWVYRAGRPVYELIDPNGQIYVMQSYHIEKNALTDKRLAILNAELNLPKGWQFRSGLLKRDVELTTSNNQAVVIQDDLLNTYQLATVDMLSPI